MLVSALAYPNTNEQPNIMDSLSQILNSGLLNPDSLNARGPKVVWPSKFSVKFSTDTMLYNTTISMKFDSPGNRIWTQLNYTSPIFGGFEAFQMAILPNTKNVTLKIDDECRWAYVYDVSYIYLNLIFTSWPLYTKYIGQDKEGLHEFQLFDFIQSEKVGNITFLFKEKTGKNDLELVKVGAKNSKTGIPLMLKVIEPVTDRPDMSDKDFQFGEIKWAECTSEKFNKFTEAITMILQFLKDVFLSTVSSITKKYGDKIPGNLRDLLNR